MMALRLVILKKIIEIEKVMSDFSNVLLLFKWRNFFRSLSLSFLVQCEIPLKWTYFYKK